MKFFPYCQVQLFMEPVTALHKMQIEFCFDRFAIVGYGGVTSRLSTTMQSHKEKPDEQSRPCRADRTTREL